MQNIINLWERNKIDDPWWNCDDEKKRIKKSIITENRWFRLQSIIDDQLIWRALNRRLTNDWQTIPTIVWMLTWSRKHNKWSEWQAHKQYMECIDKRKCYWNEQLHWSRARSVAQQQRERRTAMIRYVTRLRRQRIIFSINVLLHANYASNSQYNE